jgi:hypothetical protein
VHRRRAHRFEHVEQHRLGAAPGVGRQRPIGEVAGELAQQRADGDDGRLAPAARRTVQVDGAEDGRAALDGVRRSGPDPQRAGGRQRPAASTTAWASTSSTSPTRAP